MRKAAALALLTLLAVAPAFALDSTAIPTKFPIPWGNSAGAGYVRVIPTTSQIGIQNCAASLTDGFPPLTFTSAAAGGCPPFGQDMNGILKQITQWSRWQNAGAPVFYDSGFSASIGGYPKWSILSVVASPGCLWISTTQDNVTNPDAAGAGWVNTCTPSVGGVLAGALPNPTLAAGAVTASAIAAGAAASNIGTLGGVLVGTLPNPSALAAGSVTAAAIAAGAASSNIGGLGGVLTGTLPSPGLASGAAAGNIGSLGGVLTGTLPSPGMAASGVTPGTYKQATVVVAADGRITSAGSQPPPQHAEIASGSGTYTPSGGASRMVVQLVGGGGGGGSTGGAGTNGTLTSFCGWQGLGGTAGQPTTPGSGGAGGSSGAGNVLQRRNGNAGEFGPTITSAAATANFTMLFYGLGGISALTPFGNGGPGLETIALVANTTSQWPGGGGAGEYVEFDIPAQACAYTVGVGGVTAGGRSGSDGRIYITVYFD